VYTWEEGTTYDVRGDIDLDGDVDSTDASTISSDYSGITLGRGELSDGGVRNRRGYAGYEFDDGIGSQYHVRHRVLEAALGRWTSRDPLGNVDGVNYYYYVSCNPAVLRDPFGQTACGLREDEDCGSCRVYCVRTKQHWVWVDTAINVRMRIKYKCDYSCTPQGLNWCKEGCICPNFHTSTPAIGQQGTVMTFCSPWFLDWAECVKKSREHVL